MNEAGVRHFAARLGIALVGGIKSTGWIDACCPFAFATHDSGRDRNPSFGVHVNETGYSTYKCFTCKEHGSFPNLAFRLAHFTENADLREIGREIETHELFETDEAIPDWEDEQDENTETPNPRLDPAEVHARYPAAFLFGKPRRYLARRGIDFFTSLTLNLRWDAEQDRVLFPCYDFRGALVGLSGRAVNPTADLRVRDYLGLPKRRILLGEHRVGNRTDAIRRGAVHGWHGTADSAVVVVEGLFDYARLVAARLPNVVALLGSELTPEKQQRLEDFDRPVIWMPDNDGAGRTILYGPRRKDGGHDLPQGALYRMYGLVPQLTVTYPDGVKDPADLTNAQLRAMIAGAELFLKERS